MLFLESHDASVLNLANQLGSEVAATERLDSRLIRSLAQRPDGQDTAEMSDVTESEVSVDENVTSKLQVYHRIKRGKCVSILQTMQVNPTFRLLSEGLECPLSASGLEWPLFASYIQRKDSSVLYL
jgi:hypothetical protein